MFLPLQGQFGVHAEASILSVPGFDLPPEHGDAFAHADESLAGHGAVGGLSRDAATIVAYVDLDVMLAVSDRHFGSCRAGVLERVAECLLDDPEGREVHPRLEPPLLALDRQVHVE